MRSESPASSKCARQTLRDLDEPIDLLFLDGWKVLYLPVLELLEPKLRPGALVIGDDLDIARERLASYLARVRGPGYSSIELSIGDAMEIWLRARRAPYARRFREADLRAVLRAAEAGGRLERDAPLGRRPFAGGARGDGQRVHAGLQLPLEQRVHVTVARELRLPVEGGGDDHHLEVRLRPLGHAVVAALVDDVEKGGRELGLEALADRFGAGHGFSCSETGNRRRAWNFQRPRESLLRDRHRA
jgi:hypothetical protein